VGGHESPSSSHHTGGFQRFLDGSQDLSGAIDAVAGLAGDLTEQAGSLQAVDVALGSGKSDGQQPVVLVLAMGLQAGTKGKKGLWDQVPGAQQRQH
jgi:hypothetical protein